MTRYLRDPGLRTTINNKNSLNISNSLGPKTSSSILTTRYPPYITLILNIIRCNDCVINAILQFIVWIALEVRLSLSAPFSIKLACDPSYYVNQYMIYRYSPLLNVPKCLSLTFLRFPIPARLLLHWLEHRSFWQLICHGMCPFHSPIDTS